MNGSIDSSGCFIPSMMLDFGLRLKENTVLIWLYVVWATLYAKQTCNFISHATHSHIVALSLKCSKAVYTYHEIINSNDYSTSSPIFDWFVMQLSKILLAKCSLNEKKLKIINYKMPLRLKIHFRFFLKFWTSVCIPPFWQRGKLKKECKRLPVEYQQQAVIYSWTG